VAPRRRQSDAQPLSGGWAVNATLHAASLDDLQEAIDCAERAWREPTWRNMLPHQRAKILHKVADLIESS
jgi:betaine-aldehyde dehydrogenase